MVKNFENHFKIFEQNFGDFEKYFGHFREVFRKISDNKFPEKGWKFSKNISENENYIGKFSIIISKNLEINFGRFQEILRTFLTGIFENFENYFGKF